MAKISRAALLDKIIAVITSQTAPESITPATLGDLLNDFADSTWNREDWEVDDLIIPTSLNGQITGPPRSAQEILQVILNNLDIVMSGNTNAANQGRPGLFLAYVGTNQQLVELIPGGVNQSHGKLKCVNDFEQGGFDNGNNWSTYSFKVPAGGFNGVIAVDACEIEVVEPASTTTTMRLQMLKNGSAAGMPNTTFSFASTLAATDKIYTNYFEMNFSGAPLVEGDEITIDITAPAGVGGGVTGTFKINAGSISNQD